MISHYYLGVKTLEDAAAALQRLSFITVLDPSAMTLEITGIDRIGVAAAPASVDGDLAKGVALAVFGDLTASECQEVESLAGLADEAVTLMVRDVCARSMAELSKGGYGGVHVVLERPRPDDNDSD